MTDSNDPPNRVVKSSGAHPVPLDDPAAERELARAVVRGDRAALEKLHALYSAPLYRFVFFRLGGKERDVEELVQETFLAALKGFHRFRGESSLYTWLCGIARHLLSHARRDDYRARLAVTLDSVDEELDRALAAIDNAPLADEVIERAETHDLVGATMSALPVSYQQVLARKYLGESSVAEIAAELGTSRKAVESTLARARAAFRATWKLIAGRLAGESRPTTERPVGGYEHG
ncbi:MAG: RNA polymerase sigma factor [Planctomycetota bacterium]